MKKIITLVLVIGFTPFVTFAEELCKGSDTRLDSLGHIINWASCTLIEAVIPLLFTLATAGFIWGVVQFFIYPDNEEKRKKSKSFMLWGIIALFVMVSVWGLVGILTDTFGIKVLIPQLSQ